MTHDEAHVKALEFIRTECATLDVDKLTIIEDSTREEPFGWVFFWDDMRFVEGDDRYGLCGNLPIVVLRATGRVMYLPHNSWDHDIEGSIRAFAASSGRE